MIKGKGNINISVKSTRRKRVNKQGYKHHKSGKFVGPYWRNVHKFPKTYYTYRMVNGENRLVKITRIKGKDYMTVIEDRRLAERITMEQAKKHFESLPKKRQEADKRKRAKETFKQTEITSKYLSKSGTRRYDVEGLDTPPAEIKAKIKELEQELSQLKDTPQAKDPEIKEKIREKVKEITHLDKELEKKEQKAKELEKEKEEKKIQDKTTRKGDFYEEFYPSDKKIIEAQNIKIKISELESKIYDLEHYHLKEALKKENEMQINAIKKNIENQKKELAKKKEELKDLEDIKWQKKPEQYYSTELDPRYTKLLKEKQLEYATVKGNLANIKEDIEQTPEGELKENFKKRLENNIKWVERLEKEIKELRADPKSIYWDDKLIEVTIKEGKELSNEVIEKMPEQTKQKYNKMIETQKEEKLKKEKKYAEEQELIKKKQKEKEVVEKEAPKKLKEMQDIFVKNAKGKYEKKIWNELKITNDFGDVYGILDSSKISFLTINKQLEGTKLGDEFKDHKEVKLEENLIMNQYGFDYDLGACNYNAEYVDLALKSLNNPKVYYKENTPLLIKDNNYSFMLAPRIAEKVEDSEEEIKEKITNLKQELEAAGKAKRSYYSQLDKTKDPQKISELHHSITVADFSISSLKSELYFKESDLEDLKKEKFKSDTTIRITPDEYKKLIKLMKKEEMIEEYKKLAEKYPSEGKVESHDKHQALYNLLQKRKEAEWHQKHKEKTEKEEKPKAQLTKKEELTNKDLDTKVMRVKETHDRINEILDEQHKIERDKHDLAIAMGKTKSSNKKSILGKKYDKLGQRNSDLIKEFDKIGKEHDDLVKELGMSGEELGKYVKKLEGKELKPKFEVVDMYGSTIQKDALRKEVEKPKRSHTIKLVDTRPIGTKNTKMCIICGATGKDLTKYKTCEAYFKKPIEKL